MMNIIKLSSSYILYYEVDIRSLLKNSDTKTYTVGNYLILYVKHACGGTTTSEASPSRPFSSDL